MERQFRRLRLGLVVVAVLPAVDGAEFRNFALPCLAPLLEQVDPEAPATVGLAFLDGPSRAPVLRRDVGSVDFPIATGSQEAAAFFAQGVALLHAFANREAERSFRQALLLDPGNPMVLWGLAMANEQRPQRARLFAQNALRRINNETSARERLWIESLARFHAVDRDGPATEERDEELDAEQIRERHRERIRDLEALVLAFPKDVEAKAFLLRQLVLDAHRSGIRITSHVAVDRLAEELAELAPKHPSRHYRIFLWLRERPSQALVPAQTSPTFAPGVADSWRYAAEAWRANGKHHQAVPLLEAALRVDHGHLRARLAMPGDAPTLVSNYAALIESLARMGRVEEALQWTERLLGLPRRIEPNRGGDRGWDPRETGRRLFVETLLRAEQTERLLRELESNPLLQVDPDHPRDRAHWLCARGLALGLLGRTEALAAVEREVTAVVKVAAPQDRPEVLSWIEELQAIAAVARGELPAKSESGLPGVPPSVLARAVAKAGHPKEALELARRGYNERPGELIATAAYCELSVAAGEAVSAMAAFDRTFRENAMRADDGLPILDRLGPLAAQMQLPKRWKLPAAVSETPGAPDDPEALGPLLWEPSPAPEWSLPNHAGRVVSLDEFRGRAVLLNFFLGVNCPFCLRQLDAFRQHLAAFEAAGITMVAISTDSVEQLAARLGSAEEKPAEVARQFPFTVLADPKFAAFRAYGVYDDFEAGPMHGTILIGPEGGILWSDVSHEPFSRPVRLLNEARRLLEAHRALRDAPAGQ